MIKKIRSGAIGIFDSGVGGLTVVKEIRRILPFEDLIYFGDTARVPYGIKSAETIQSYASEITSFLINQDVKLIVAACNTVSSMAMDYLKNNFPYVPIMGVVEPGVNAALNETKNKRIGIIGTVATIKSSAYKNLLLMKDSSLKIFQRACPLFVPIVEEGWEKHKIAELAAGEYLSPLKKDSIDTLVLGCTHYPLLKSVIKKVMGPSVRLIDSAEEVARGIKNLLSEYDVLSKRKKNGRITCYLSDRSDFFINAAERMLNQKIKIIQKRF